MTIDVVLVVFHHYEPEALRRLEKKYFAIITTLTFAPALAFLFVRSAESGPLYGSVTVSTVVDSVINQVLNAIHIYSSGARSLPTGCFSA